MIKSPKILFNPNNKDVEFMFDHLVYVFRPGEKKFLDYDVAIHGLGSGCGVIEYDGSSEAKFSEGIAYDKMPWRELVSVASKRGLFKPPMAREEVIKAMEEADERARAL
jgi:hypothetical protein